MKILAVIGAALHTIVSLFIVVTAPLLFEGNTSYTVAVILFQLLAATISITAIILIGMRQWTPLLWLLGFSTVYSIMDVGWRIGSGFDPSIVLVLVLLYMWQVFGIITAVHGRARRTVHSFRSS